MWSENFLRLALVILAAIPTLVAASKEAILQEAEQHIQKEQFAAAEPLLEAALKQEPGDTQVLYRLGYVQYRQRKLEPALRHFSTVVAKAPPAFHARYFLGRIALLQNQPKKAVEWLEPIVDAKQPVFDAAARLAGAYADLGHREKATAALRIAIGQAPWDSALYYRLGQLHVQGGHKELAREAFENSRRLQNANRQDVEALMRSSQLLSEGKKEEGIQAGSLILARKDADPNALVALGVIYGNANLQHEALEAFERAADRDAQFFQAHYNRGLALLKLNRAGDALAPLARAAELLPQSLEANLTYGLAAVMGQRYSDAVPPLERAWQMDSKNARTGALLATCYLRTGAAGKAVTLLQSESLRSAPDPAPLLLLVEARNATEDQNGALVAAREAQKRFANAPQVQMAVAQQLARLGRYQEARPVFEETLKLAPGLPEAELGIADALQKFGDHAAALDHYRAAVSSGRTELAASAGLARSLVALRQLEEARKLLESGITKYPAEAALRVELARVYARLGRADLAAEQTKAVERLRSEQAASK